MSDLIINIEELLENIRERFSKLLSKSSKNQQKIEQPKPIEQIPVNKEQFITWIDNPRTRLIGGFGNLNTNTHTEIKNDGGKVY